MSLRELRNKVNGILKRIAKKFFGGARKAIRRGAEVLKKRATQEYKLLLGIVRDAGLEKMAELAKIASEPGSWKGRKWKVFAKGFFKDYFERVGEKWNPDQRLPERVLDRLLVDLYNEFRP